MRPALMACVLILAWVVAGCGGGSCEVPNPDYDPTIPGSEACLDVTTPANGQFQANQTRTAQTCPSGKTGPNCDICTEYATGPNCETYKFVTIDFDAYHGCGVHPDGAITCYDGTESGYRPFIGSDFKDVAVGWKTRCALREDNTVVCLKDIYGNEIDNEVPEGSFKAISAGDKHVCAIRMDDTVSCWGDEDEDALTPPEGTFAQAEAGRGFSCGLRFDGTAECWGSQTDTEIGMNYPHEGTFTDLAVNWLSCGLREDGSIECWGFGCYNTIDQDLGYELNELPPGVCAIPPGTYSSMVLSSNNLCGLSIDGTISCWGVDVAGETSPPEGEFDMVELAVSYGCALRPDQTIACWGSEQHTAQIGQVLNLWKCNDGREIHADGVCDFYDDCLDGSDEAEAMCAARY